MSAILLSQLLDHLTPLPVEVVDITGLSNDSRTLEAGSLFLACPGEQVDGRDFIAVALSNHPAAICYQLDDDYQLPQLSTDIPLIGIKNLRQCQGVIAARFYQDPSADMTVIGVTGTNGKTSCTQFIAQALAQHQQRCGVMGTMGVGFLSTLTSGQLTTAGPIVLQQQLMSLKKAGASVIAMEVSSHSLVQHRVAGVHFDIAVFTQLSREHLDYHGDMQTYASAKARLFQQPGLKYAVLNMDDRIGRRLAEEYATALEVITYSAQGHAECLLPAIVATQITPLTQGFKVAVNTPWGAGEFVTRLLGEFNISNLLAVMGVLGVMRIELKDILKYLENITTVAGRMQLFQAKNKPAVVVDYSHTPDALEKALRALRVHCQGQLWCVFGSGGDRDAGTRPEKAKVAERFADRVIVTNDNSRSESPQTIADEICQGFDNPQAVTVELDRAAAIALAIQSAAPNDMVLIAGKGHESTQIIGDQVLPFSDIEQVSALL